MPGRYVRDKQCLTKPLSAHIHANTKQQLGQQPPTAVCNSTSYRNSSAVSPAKVPLAMMRIRLSCKSLRRVRMKKEYKEAPQTNKQTNKHSRSQRRRKTRPAAIPLPHKSLDARTQTQKHSSKQPSHPNPQPAPYSSVSAVSSAKDPLPMALIKLLCKSLRRQTTM
jgi:hypothetical protein